MPVSEDLNRATRGLVGRPGVEDRAGDLARRHGFFHWHTAFPEVMESRGGFDVVLANPPWERIKLQEKEFFATRSPRVARARTKAARRELIEALVGDGASTAEQALHAEFQSARRDSEAHGQFLRRSGRFPLTSHGDINTYAVFAETCLDLLNERGRVGVIVPTGIATDHSTKRFFRAIVEDRRLASLRDFENRTPLFKGVHRSYKFCLLTLGSDVTRASCIFFATKTAHLRDERRRFELVREDIQLMNPNSRTAPVFRSTADAALARKIYSNVPVLINNCGDSRNPWGIRFMRMFDMTNDSGLFRTYHQLAAIGARLKGRDWADPDGNSWVPLAEAKMIHQFNPRWATYGMDGKTLRVVTELEQLDPQFNPLPRYWVPKTEVDTRLDRYGWHKNWLIGWRDITNATNERTMIATMLPRCGVGNNLPLLFCSNVIPTNTIFALIGNLNSIVLDFIARLKVCGTHMNYFILQQLPVLNPMSYTKHDLDFIVPRVARIMDLKSPNMFSNIGSLTSTQTDDMPNCYGTLRAQLDAYFAKLYGLDLDELSYILDPKDTHGENYPSESFRILRDRELKEFNEYRTRNLVLGVLEFDQTFRLNYEAQFGYRISMQSTVHVISRDRIVVTSVVMREVQSLFQRHF